MSAAFDPVTTTLADVQGYLSQTDKAFGLKSDPQALQFSHPHQ
jgi:hypothetical protein